MSLPSSLDSSEEFFLNSVKFFSKYRHLFEIPNTDILKHNFSDIDVQNLESVPIFEQHFDLPAIRDKNEFLKDFFEEYDKLKINYDEFNRDNTWENIVKVSVPVSPKKKHEIVYLAKEIKEVCAQNGCDVVVDFGSGLGYLDQLLYETTKLKILGIECNASHYVGAKTRQKKYHIDSVKDVKYVNHTINKNSDQNIQEHLEKKFGISNFCITGLHACADLTIDGVNLFLKMPDAKVLIVMPCCYHKMAPDSSNGRFCNFPLSSSLKEIFERNQCDEYMRVPFLRLAAQPPNKHAGLEDLVFNLLARATLQLYVNRNGYHIRRNKRKAVRTKTVNRDFSEYLQNAKVGFTIEHAADNLTSVDLNLEELQKIWREVENLRLHAAIFILLQTYLQPLVENFVLYDRLEFLKENGIKNCYIKKIFNENVSSKGLALISIK